MSDVLMIPAPEYCTTPRFNMWLSQICGLHSPLLGIPLRDACAGSPINPFALGCIAVVASKQFTIVEALERRDFFFTGGVYDSDLEACAYALQKAMGAGGLDRYPGMKPEEIAQVRGLYAQFVRYAKRMAGEPRPLPPPIPAPEPVPPQKPTPTPVPPPAPSEPAPLPAPAPVPAPPAAAPKWKSTVKILTAILTAILAAGAWLIPSQFEVPLRALLAMLKALVGG